MLSLTSLHHFASKEYFELKQLQAVKTRCAPAPAALASVASGVPTKAAETLDVKTAGELLWHLPFRHEDRGEIVPTVMLRVDQDATISGEITKIAARRAWRRNNMTVVEATVADETGEVKAVWFNQPWLPKKLPVGSTVLLHGRYTRSGLRVSEYELTTASVGSVSSAAGLVPVYPATDGFSSMQIRDLIRSHKGFERALADPLPTWIRVQEHLPELTAALAGTHYPRQLQDPEAARERLAFDELFLLQLVLLKRRSENSSKSAPILDQERSLTESWLREQLPFTLTEDQNSAVQQVDLDLSSARPMQRLLLGEVGSGKTVVALYAMLRAVDCGRQAAMMAPTETLAEQHFETLQRLVGDRLVTMALLTGSTPQARRKTILAQLASGELKIVVGTHALIEDSVQFDSLAVAVVDEQHRFGVDQRVAIDSKTADGLATHTLHMTATPIPRTLALTMYGDLDFTTLRQLPKGRKPIDTFIASSDRARARAYERLREELRMGRQGYVVCPLVKESENLEAKAAEHEFERLCASELKEFSVELLHGQMSAQRKREVMARFVAGTAQVLVSTTVIEVGIDVPNATVMLIENAERYGISQLHQLRGRIGRGEHRSLCLLFGPEEAVRLKAMVEHSDGFKLAEIDLQLRKEGEIVGTKQSGVARFKSARLPQDIELLKRARLVAEKLLAEDSELVAPTHHLLKAVLEDAYGEATAQSIPA